jgi:hypothetical protein
MLASISGVVDFSAVNGPPGAKRDMKNVAVTMTNNASSVCNRREMKKRVIG